MTLCALRRPCACAVEFPRTPSIHTHTHTHNLAHMLLGHCSGGGGGKVHYFGGEGRSGGSQAGAHTAIRDLQSSGASTIGMLQPLGSADSLGMSPGAAMGGRHNTEDLDSMSSPASMWQSHRTDNGQQPMSR